MELCYKTLVANAIRDIAFTSAGKIDTVKRIKNIFGVSLLTAKSLYEEVYPRTEIHENIMLYSTKPVGVCYNNDDNTITIVMADSIEEAMKVEIK